ncbi:MAG: putative hydrolase of the superfamily [Actinomycetota bacterium]|jgi:putative hydrolase of the HAD superfamily|nr:putative hydrolase of the superfamily [Actinomycetota bacterium]
MSPSLEAVTFDFWNTLVVDGGGTARDDRLDAWIGILEDAGFATERSVLDKAMASSWDRFVTAWQSGEQYTRVEAAVDIVEALGYTLPAGVHEALVSSFTYSTSNYPALTDGIADCLRVLKGAGLRLGIICDVGMTPSSVLRDILEHFGVLGFFDHWSFSDEVGYYKPSALIFEHALSGLGVSAAARAAHVGDLRRTDVAGALGMGMTAVRYTGAFDDSAYDGVDTPLVVSSHLDLPAVLGIA